MRFVIGFCMNSIYCIASKGQAQSYVVLRILPVAEAKSEEIFSVYNPVIPAVASTL